MARWISLRRPSGSLLRKREWITFRRPVDHFYVDDRSVVMNQEVQPRYGYEDEIDLVEAFQILLKSWKLIAVFFLITVFVVGSITYFLVPKKYRSHTLLAIEAEDQVQISV